MVMGVSGVGKSAIGSALAQRLGWTFVDADDEHPPANRDKMTRGLPLDDADRAPWLERLRRHVVRHLARGESLVLACSALKAAYRDTLAAGDERVLFVHLTAPRDLLVRRLSFRSGHWFPPGLLDSQLATLEVPDDAIVVDAGTPLDEAVSAAVAAVEGRGSG